MSSSCLPRPRGGTAISTTCGKSRSIAFGLTRPLYRAMPANMPPSEPSASGIANFRSGANMIARRWVNFRYYGADDTSVFNRLDYIFLAPNWKRLVPDQKPWGSCDRDQPAWQGRSKPSPRINIKTFQVGQQTGSTVWPRYAQLQRYAASPIGRHRRASVPTQA